MRILGIDPGSNATGFGVVESRGRRLAARAHGTLRPPRGAPLSTRLAALRVGLAEVIAAHAPDVVVVERAFFARSAHAALVLGQARGVALAAAGEAGLPVEEYSASQIKRAVASTGRADKDQVRSMVARLLGLPEIPGSDAADALAAAICRAQASPLAGLSTGARRRRRGRRTAPVRRAAP